MLAYNLINYDKTRKELDEYPKKLANVEQRMVSDIRRWVPGHISTATAKIYAISKSEVAAIKATKAADGNYYRGRNAGKGNVRVSSSGDTVASLTFTFRGAKHASWPTRAGKQQKVPKARKRFVKDGRIYSIPKPYVTTVETYKGQRTPIKPRGNNRVFVMQGKQGLVAMHVRAGERKPMAHGSSSIPQAITNEKVVAIWQPQLNEYILKRLANHNKQAFK